MLPDGLAASGPARITHPLSLKMRQSQGSRNPDLGFQHGYGERKVNGGQTAPKGRANLQIPADIEELLPPLAPDRLAVQAGKLHQGVAERRPGRRNRGLRVAMRAPDRLRHDL